MLEVCEGSQAEKVGNHCVLKWPPLHWLLSSISSTVHPISNDKPLHVSHSRLYLACRLVICLSVINDCWTLSSLHIMMALSVDGCWADLLSPSVFWHPHTHAAHTCTHSWVSQQRHEKLCTFLLWWCCMWVIIPLECFQGSGTVLWTFVCVFSLVIHLNGAKWKGIQVIHR